MIIAINSNSFIKSAGNDFFYAQFLKIAATQPDHRFIFITPPETDFRSGHLQNITHVVSSPRADNRLMWGIWLRLTLPGIARKYKADIVINTGSVCSPRNGIKQWICISDLAFNNSPQYFLRWQTQYAKKNMPGFLAKADTIVTASHLLAKEIINKYQVDEKKILTFPLSADPSYQPIDWKEKEAIKEKYAEGKEYFLFRGEIDERSNLLNLLKAFSFFKKRQKSNMQLIIAATSVAEDAAFVRDLKTYKYRAEVLLMKDLQEEEMAKMTAAAYAFVYPVLYEGLPIFPSQAMQCEVPVVTSNFTSIAEVAGDAALYVDPGNFEDIAYKMMLVFKDENKRADMINKAKSLLANNGNLPDDWWQAIQNNTGLS